MRVPRFFSAIVALVLSVQTGFATESDVRQLMSVDSQSDWLAVGRMNVAGQGYCTATLVGPSLVLTAAHCVIDRRSGEVVRPERVHFLAGFRSGTFAAHGKASAIRVVNGYRGGRQHTMHKDLALVHLSAPMPDEITPLGLQPVADSGDKLASFSYGIDRAQVLSRQDGCHVMRRSGALLFTSCEGVPGVSGAPLVRHTVDGPKVVAVASSVATREREPIVRGNLIAVVASATALDGLAQDLGLGDAQAVTIGSVAQTVAAPADHWVPTRRN